jgi:hypothetical protein
LRGLRVDTASARMLTRPVLRNGHHWLNAQTRSDRLSVLVTAQIVATDTVDAAGVAGTRTPTRGLRKLSDEGRDVTSVLCFDTLVHSARLEAIQRAILAEVALGHGDAIRVDTAASVVVSRADRWDVCAAIADVFATTDHGQQCKKAG